MVMDIDDLREKLEMVPKDVPASKALALCDEIDRLRDVLREVRDKSDPERPGHDLNEIHELATDALE